MWTFSSIRLVPTLNQRRRILMPFYYTAQKRGPLQCKLHLLWRNYWMAVIVGCYEWRSASAGGIGSLMRKSSRMSPELLRLSEHVDLGWLDMSTGTRS
eukprot:sb/3478929/